jgi:hypothetical protein
VLTPEKPALLDGVTFSKRALLQKTCAQHRCAGDRGRAAVAPGLPRPASLTNTLTRRTAAT